MQQQRRRPQLALREMRACGGGSTESANARGSFCSCHRTRQHHTMTSQVWDSNEPAVWQSLRDAYPSALQHVAQNPRRADVESLDRWGWAKGAQGVSVLAPAATRRGDDAATCLLPLPPPHTGGGCASCPRCCKAGEQSPT